MTTIPQQETIVQYTANSAQFNYTFDFYAPTEEDLQVYYQASNAIPIPETDILVLNVDYTVTYNADPLTGGFITLLFTPTTGFLLTINRQVAATLTVNFDQAQNFNGSNLNAVLIRLLLLIQQNQNYALQRNLSYIINTYLPNATPFTQLPPLADNYIWIGSGSGVVAAFLEQNPDVSTLRSQLANDSPFVNGASIVGYYNNLTATPTTVMAQLDANVSAINSINTALATLNLPGIMIDYAGTSAPSGWLLCNGAAVSRTTYAALFAAIGTTWGIGDGSTTFNVPDRRRRVTVGSGGSGTGILGNTTGSVGGEESHAQTINEMAAHRHNPNGTGSTSATKFLTKDTVSPQATWITTSPNINMGFADNTAETGGGQPFNIVQPSVVVTAIIKF